MPTFHAYAANAARGPFQPFEFDPGEIGHEEVEIKVSHSGICHSDLSTLDNDWSEYRIPSTARVGVIGIGGLDHLALQFANKWGCEVHAFTTSDNKRAEAHKLGARYVHNTKQDEALKELAGSLDLIISTINGLRG